MAQHAHSSSLTARSLFQPNYELCCQRSWQSTLAVFFFPAKSPVSRTLTYCCLFFFLFSFTNFVLVITLLGSLSGCTAFAGFISEKLYHTYVFTTHTPMPNHSRQKFSEGVRRFYFCEFLAWVVWHRSLCRKNELSGLCSKNEVSGLT